MRRAVWAFIAAGIALAPCGAHAVAAKQRAAVLAGIACHGGFYVDPVNGNDANSGLSFSQPKKNVSALPVPVTVKVCIKNGVGALLQDQVLALDVGGSVEGYGPGPLATIDAGAIIANGGITKTPATTNTYQVTINLPPATISGRAPAGPWVNVWECKSAPCGEKSLGGNDTFYLNQSSEANVDTTAGSYFISGMTTSAFPAGATATLFFHTSDDSDPTANGYTYIYSHQPWAVMAQNATGVVVKNVHLRRASGNDGSLAIYGDAVAPQVSNVIIGEGGKHNTVLSGGGSLSNFWIADACYGVNGGTSNNLLTWNENNGASESTLLQNGTFQNSNACNVSATLSHINTSGSFGAFTDRNIWLVSTGAIVSGGTSETLDGIICNGCSNLAFSTATLTVQNSQYVTTVAGNYMVGAQQANQTITLTNNKACAHGVVGGILFRNSSSVAGLTLAMTGNTGYFSSGQTGGFPNPYGLVYSSVAMTITSSGNLADAAANGVADTYSLFAASGNVLTSNNNHITANMQAFRYNNTDYGTLALWQAQGFDLASDAVGSGVAACTLPTMPQFAGPQ